MSDFLLELRCEEIPARMQAGARADLEKLFRAQMGAAGVEVGELTIWSTPRRLALIARDLPLTTESVSEETKGPRTSAPPQALEGFLRKTGLTQDQLEERDGVYYAVVEKPGRAVKDVLAEAIPAIIRAFPWPKSMRWGAASVSTESARWVRPLSGIVAILGEDLVEYEAGGVASGYATRGHRFHCPGEITIGSASDYQDKLRACHVIVDHEERQNTIRELARAAALAEGLVLVEDEGLVIENAGLTEWPVPLLGRFDESFLDVPPEVIQLTARVNQKYFVCEYPPRAGEDRKLANAFVCTANIVADDPAVVVDGNRKVLAARLSDARFFWEQDRKVPLAQQAEKLSRITFHEKLGTVADKVERVAKLARWLVEEGIVKPSPLQGRGLGMGAADAALAVPHPPTPSPEGEREKLADLAEQAARLCKADLVTDMVGEFPELQGLMGGYYARAEGLPDAVADAIRDHYKPVGQGDDVPTAPVTVAVSLADKLDTLASFFAIGEKPTGSKDPFALRRAIIAVESLLLTSQIRVQLEDLFSVAYYFVAWTGWLAAIEDKMFKDVSRRERWLDLITYYPNVEFAFKDGKNFQLHIRGQLVMASHSASGGDKPHFADYASCWKDFRSFAIDRLKVQQREAGVRHDLIDAVFALGGEDDLVRLLARVTALQSYVETADGANLLAGYKRAANILKKEDWQGVEGELSQTGEEDPLSGVDDPDLKAVIDAKMAMRTPENLSYTPEPAEKALIEALDAAEPKAESAIAAEDFAGAMSALASLRAPIDAFFETVTVNDADPAKRSQRLALLARFRAAVHNVADFSRIEG
ncbi:glycine--tRNA ligase subunit beta [Altererythrobacter sp. KTW20L]|uniref:glycine--tRNA ligase subunit beta n=1 Tax=Altererythrobacter sp. KTW20L TaxID=2942210 RepID=UPI0020C08459|nr:glycine--tRNA ligase subunit beta [Altererythrobacter sp. KTW20L]MCL6251990.1 glycine--tRNA ligase subunit beta [Altererythrobacter sp. KTW20L]